MVENCLRSIEITFKKVLQKLLVKCVSSKMPLFNNITILPYLSGPLFGICRGSTDAEVRNAF